MNYPAVSHRVSKVRQQHVMNHPTVSCGQTILKQVRGMNPHGNQCNGKDGMSYAFSDICLTCFDTVFIKKKKADPEGRLIPRIPPYPLSDNTKISIEYNESAGLPPGYFVKQSIG